MDAIQLVILDLDGTVIDSLADLTDATNHMLSEMGREKLSGQQVRKLVGQGARKLVERAMPDADPAEIENALDIFLSYNSSHIVDKTTLYPGVMETLKSLRNTGYLLAVISNKNVTLCLQVIATLGVADFFDAVMGADTMPYRKPSPEPIVKLLRDFAISPVNAVIVGDSINDVAAGKAAGVITVGCTYGYGEMSELEEADYLVGA
ncbi:MAG TPA: HAD-IIIA family hydrolase, partial [Geobacteraceae bacterium]|nr:HAD-IIIA family hydrolase [Geobacteraceae bacterium]